jgi:hypothetical protein
MAKLVIDFKNGYDGMELVKDFPIEDLHISYEQVGLFWKHWRATMRIDRDSLNEKQYEWILDKMTFLKRATFETRALGLSMQRGQFGEMVPFRMVMRGH